MIGLVRGPGFVRRAQKRRVVLHLEGLEGRDQPSSPQGGGDMAQTPPPPANQRPVIEGFVCQPLGRGLYLITGRVVDESPGGLTVTLGGSTSAAGRSTTTQPDGTFSMTVQLRVNGTDAGFITATTVDRQGLVSEPVSQFVDP
jgi:hypothetical protein